MSKYEPFRILQQDCVKHVDLYYENHRKWSMSNFVIKKYCNNFQKCILSYDKKS